MAISATHYWILRDMFQQGVFRPGGAILELGEANWYGDVAPIELIDDIRKHVSDPARQQALVTRMERAAESQDVMAPFEIVKIVYEMFFAPFEMQAIDYGGTSTARRLDLNRPAQLDRRFDVVINHGTAEHIFNIAQVFRTAHDYTLPGGFMIHESPFTGWVDHGFYNMQPTLFFDLAEVNEYSLIAMLIEDIAAGQIVQVERRETVHELSAAGRIGNNTMLFTVLRKRHDRPFQPPVQGYYRGALSAAGQTAWREMR
jgi:hypothetical protein